MDDREGRDRRRRRVAREALDRGAPTCFGTGLAYWHRRRELGLETVPTVDLKPALERILSGR